MAKYLHKQVNLYDLSLEERLLLWTIFEQIELLIWNNLFDPNWKERYFFLIRKSYIFWRLEIFDSDEQLRHKNLILGFVDKLPFSIKDEDNPRIIIRDNLILDIDWDCDEDFFKVKFHPDAYVDYASQLIESWEWQKIKG